MDLLTYTIKTYQEGFLEDQFRIGSAKYDYWRMGGQTRVPQMQKIYSKSDFDPETRFYAFEGDTMVAFLNAADKREEDRKVAFFEFPYYAKRHKDAIAPLVDHAFSQLKNKGFESLITRAGPYWGNTLQMAKKYGFVETQQIARAATMDLDHVDRKLYHQLSSISYFNPDKHLEGVAELVAEKFKITTDQAKQNLSRPANLSIGDTITNPWGQTLTLLSSNVADIDGKIVGRSVVMNNEYYGSKTANLMNLMVKNDDAQIKRRLMGGIIRDLIKLEYHRLIIHTGLWGIHPKDEYFDEFNLKFKTKLAYFEKQL